MFKASACSIDVCDQMTTPKTAHGLCTAHYKRHRKGTDLNSPINVRGRSIADRLWPRVIVTPSCWLWTGAKPSTGYGSISTGAGGQTTPTHLWVYRELVGDVPDGYELDHLCRVRACCNPDHLEPVPHIINARRGARALPSNRLTNGWYHPDLEGLAA